MCNSDGGLKRLDRYGILSTGLLLRDDGIYSVVPMGNVSMYGGYCKCSLVTARWYPYDVANSMVPTVC